MCLRSAPPGSRDVPGGFGCGLVLPRARELAVAALQAAATPLAPSLWARDLGSNHGESEERAKRARATTGWVRSARPSARNRPL